MAPSVLSMSMSSDGYREDSLQNAISLEEASYEHRNP